MRTNPLFGSVSLSLGIHAAIIALVLGQSGSGGGPVLPSLSTGPIVVEIVSFETVQSGTAVSGRRPSSEEVKTVKKIMKKAPEPARRSSAALPAKVTAAPPAPSISGEPAESAGAAEAPSLKPTESLIDAGPTEDDFSKAGSPGSGTPLLAYSPVQSAQALSGGSAHNGPGLGFIRAEAVDLPEPVYPPWCRRRGQEGKVVLSVNVKRDGRPGPVSVVRSSGFSMLDQAAVKALQKARFSPASAAGILVSSTRKIAYSFRITDGVN